MSLIWLVVNETVLIKHFGGRSRCSTWLSRQLNWDSKTNTLDSHRLYRPGRDGELP